MKIIKLPLTLIFLGLQGCGKGTQALEIRKRYSFDLLEVGAIFRKMAKTGRGSQEAVKIINQGKLVPSNITNKIIKSEILKIKKTKSLILDGYPRSLSQVYALSRILEGTARDKNYFAVFLDINKKTALKRLINRWTCSKCGNVFRNKKAKCSCGGKLEKRQDDKPELIKNRFKYVSGNLEKIKKYYRKKGKLKTIDAERSIGKITKDIIEKVSL